jgi:hypothetical protein
LAAVEASTYPQNISSQLWLFWDLLTLKSKEDSHSLKDTKLHLR